LELKVSEENDRPWRGELEPLTANGGTTVRDVPELRLR